MNYLAHLFLAERDDEGLVGSLLGDFVKGRPDPGLAAGVRRGIRLHRAIDTYTDAHPVHRRSRNRIGRQRRRFAGIIVDVCYDHFLSRHWDEYAEESLQSFARQVYETLRAHEPMLPGRLQTVVPRMIAQDWLCSYGELENVGRALDGISRRLRRENPLIGAVQEVRDNYESLGEDFRCFFPELLVDVARMKAELP